MLTNPSSTQDKQPQGRELKLIPFYRISIFLPLLACIPWTAMLITFLCVWKSQGSPKYAWLKPSASEGEDKAYRYANMDPVFISDVGATFLYPLFIVGTICTGVLYLLSLCVECCYWHFFCYQRNISIRVLQWVMFFFAFVGQFGIAMVSILSTKDHSVLHNVFLCVFILGILIQLILQIAQYGYLTHHYAFLTGKDKSRRFTRKNPLWISLWFKIGFCITAGILAILFKIVNFENYAINARFEWALAFGYNFLFIISSYDMFYLRRQLFVRNSTVKNKLIYQSHAVQKESDNLQTIMETVESPESAAAKTLESSENVV